MTLFTALRALWVWSHPDLQSEFHVNRATCWNLVQINKKKKKHPLSCFSSQFLVKLCPLNLAWLLSDDNYVSGWTPSQGNLEPVWRPAPVPLASYCLRDYGFCFVLLFLPAHDPLLFCYPLWPQVHFFLPPAVVSTVTISAIISSSRGSRMVQRGPL